ncbi:MAG: glutaredoxin family protein [Fibrobacterota bacterium]
MEKVHVKGEKKGDILLYALSTCGWCKKTKQLLNDLGVEYHYIDMDLLDYDEKETLMEEVRRYNPSESFPTCVVNGKAIAGYNPDELKKALRK